MLGRRHVHKRTKLKKYQPKSRSGIGNRSQHPFTSSRAPQYGEKIRTSSVPHPRKNNTTFNANHHNSESSQSHFISSANTTNTNNKPPPTSSRPSSHPSSNSIRRSPPYLAMSPSPTPYPPIPIARHNNNHKRARAPRPGTPANNNGSSYGSLHGTQFKVNTSRITPYPSTHNNNRQPTSCRALQLNKNNKRVNMDINTSLTPDDVVETMSNKLSILQRKLDQYKVCNAELKKKLNESNSTIEILNDQNKALHTTLNKMDSARRIYKSTPKFDEGKYHKLNTKKFVSPNRRQENFRIICTDGPLLMHIVKLQCEDKYGKISNSTGCIIYDDHKYMIICGAGHSLTQNPPHSTGTKADPIILFPWKREKKLEYRRHIWVERIEKGDPKKEDQIHRFRASGCVATEDWLHYEWIGYDLGLVLVKYGQDGNGPNPFIDTINNISLVVAKDEELKGSDKLLFGYPGFFKKCQGMKGPIIEVEKDYVGYNHGKDGIITESGLSGSPLAERHGDEIKVFGIHSMGYKTKNTTNRSCRITRDKQDWIRDRVPASNFWLLEESDGSVNLKFGYYF